MQNENVSDKTAMKDKVVMVTGANSGIGRAASLALAKMGATVVMVARNEERGEAARSEIVRESQNGSVDLLLADLSSLESVRQLATEFQRKYSKLHVLINNAGLFNQRRHVTMDGYEDTFATNYLAPFLLTNLQLDVLKASAPSRIINVSSVGHYNGHINFDDLNFEKEYGGWKAYGQSKLALVLFTHELAKKLQGTEVTVNAVHPGTVATNIWSRPLGPVGFIMALPKLFMTTPRQGAETIVYLASSPDAKDLNGEYLEKLKVKKSSDESYDEEIAQRLWDVSAKLTRLS
ncbi:MAG TPA: SDR family oxidoreductase [Candidatus Bathyarchaeia archaeon]|nr:SDR family oxidoreductase [Candidatus Bathyarchaeia archaeon]